MNAPSAALVHLTPRCTGGQTPAGATGAPRGAARAASATPANPPASPAAAEAALAARLRKARAPPSGATSGVTSARDRPCAREAQLRSEAASCWTRLERAAARPVAWASAASSPLAAWRPRRSTLVSGGWVVVAAGPC